MFAETYGLSSPIHSVFQVLRFTAGPNTIKTQLLTLLRRNVFFAFVYR